MLSCRWEMRDVSGVVQKVNMEVTTTIFFVDCSIMATILISFDHLLWTPNWRHILGVPGSGKQTLFWLLGTLDYGNLLQLSQIFQTPLIVDIKWH